MHKEVNSMPTSKTKPTYKEVSNMPYQKAYNGTYRKPQSQPQSQPKPQPKTYQQQPPQQQSKGGVADAIIRELKFIDKRLTKWVNRKPVSIMDRIDAIEKEIIEIKGMVAAIYDTLISNETPTPDGEIVEEEVMLEETPDHEW